MVLSADTFTLVFYLMQQLGMMLGFGAEVVLLFTYLFGKRMGVINETEDRIAHGIYRVLLVALFLIVASGASITAQYFLSGQESVVLQPAFLFKWALILIAVVCAMSLKGSRIWNSFLEGFSGANWGVLFLIHIFAPVTTLLILTEFYGVWVAGFLCVWYILVFTLHPKRASGIRAATPPPPSIKRTPFVSQKTEAPHVSVVPPPPQKPPAPIQTPQPIPPPPKPPIPAVIVPPPPPVVATTPPQELRLPAPPLPIQPVMPAEKIKIETPLPSPQKPPAPIQTPQPVVSPATVILDPEALPGLPAVRVMPQTREELEEQAQFHRR